MKICPACSTEYSAERTHCERDGVMLVALATGASGRPEDLVGRTVDGRYLVEAIIGKGGMGTVYACRHIVVGKPFAMKVLRSGIEQTEGVLQRFIREAQTANSVRSRHIVEMTDFGQLPSGQFYMTMDLLQGMDLGKALKKGLSPAELYHVFIQTAEVLELTHQRGIVHRDLKPDNIFLVREDDDPLFVKLLDFGIAKALHAGPSNLTDTGIILGTPYYMSPEQARGEGIDHRTDIYSLGVIMYRAFTGKLPFIADSAMGVLTRHLTERPELPSRLSGIDPLTERVILCCLEKKPADRFASMAALAGALRSIRGGERAVLGMRDDANARDGGAFGPPPSISGAIQAYGSGAHGPSLGSGSGPVVSPYAPPPPPSHPFAASPVSQPFSASGSQPFAASGSQPSAAPMSQGFAPVSQPFAPSSQGFAPPPSHALAGPPSDGRAPQSVHQPFSQAYTSPELPGPQGEQTGRGLAASHAMRREVPRKRWPLVLGALAMLAVGSALAATIEMLARSSGPTGAAGSPVQTSSVAATAPTTAASAVPEPSSSATEIPTAAASAAPSASATVTTAVTTTAAASATAKAPGGSRQGSGSGTPKPQPSATASVRRPAEIRSPFD